MKQPPQITDRNMQIIINMLQVQEGGYFNQFINMLRDWLDQHRIYGDTAEDNDLISNQGAIRLLAHLIKEVDENRDRYNKMQGQR